MDQNLRLDIRIIKFQDYIRRKPNSPFGYYGLGVQYMLAEKTNLADKMFSQALKIDPCYIPAKLGKLEFLLAERKFIAAARYYHKNRTFFLKKNIYIRRVHNITSSLYLSRIFLVHLGRLRSLFVFNDNFGALQKMFKNSNENPVVNILLAMYSVKEEKNDDRSLMLYNLCANMNGIIDKFRWDLVQILSQKQPEILQNDKVAGLFQSIPENAYRIDYLNFILSCFIEQQNKEKVMGAFSDLRDKHLMLGNKTMWEYINFCHNKNVWDSTVASCCQKLIEDGWVNGFLLKTAIQLKNKGIVNAGNRMFKILSLYGYTEATS